MLLKKLTFFKYQIRFQVTYISFVFEFVAMFGRVYRRSYIDLSLAASISAQLRPCLVAAAEKSEQAFLSSRPRG